MSVFQVESEKQAIYLDNAASCKMDESVIKEIRAYLSSGIVCNPSSRHNPGIMLSRKLNYCKKQISALLGVGNKFIESNLVFTSGATEANNLTIRGWCTALKRRGTTPFQQYHIVLGCTEHDCVREAVRNVVTSSEGVFTCSETKLLVNGELDMKHFVSILQPNTILVCQMAVNNQFGTIYDLSSVANVMKEKCPNALLHVDAVQAVGKIAFNIQVLSNIVSTSITLSGHKIYGPKGIGCVLFDDNRSEKTAGRKLTDLVDPLVFGGGQENGLRSGTENVLGIIGLAKGIEVCCGEIQALEKHYFRLFKAFCSEMETQEKKLEAPVCYVVTETRSCFAIFSVYVPGIAAEIVFSELSKRKVYVSVGSACQTRDSKLSPTIVARLGKDKARNVLRFSCCKFTTEGEVRTAVRTLFSILADKMGKNMIRREEETKDVEMEDKPSVVQEVVGEKKKMKKKKKKKWKKVFIDDDLLGGPCRILVREGELSLKKKNRKQFEKQLARNISSAIKGICECNVDLRDRRIYVMPRNPADYPLIGSIGVRILQVFGVSSISYCYKVASTAESIKAAVLALAQKKLQPNNVQKFRVTTKRSWKQFPINSDVFSRQLGAVVRGVSRELFTVDLRNFDFEIGVDIRSEGTYIFGEKVQGLGGMPVGSAGKGVVLLSGGIDSPTASWLMMKRGMGLNFCSFFSFPYTSQKYNDKIRKLVEVLAYFQQTPGRLFLVPFTKVQELIRDKCPEKYRTILYRRAMNFIALKVVRKTNSRCLITGESLGQVASQTIQNITSIRNAAGNVPILRPLIGMDKSDIMVIAKKVGTFEVSIIPENDTCTLFQPKSPLIFSKLDEVLKVEEKIREPLQKLFHEAFKEARVFKVSTNMFLERAAPVAFAPVQEQQKKQDDGDVVMMDKPKVVVSKSIEDGSGRKRVNREESVMDEDEDLEEGKKVKKRKIE